jgi:hypothetical protein
MSHVLTNNSKLNAYRDLSKIDLIIDRKLSKYPFNIKSHIEYTQNQLILYYKNDYILSSDEVNISKEGGNMDFSVNYIFY